ncbi:hypothetical protein ACWGB8_31060 [Kitasatospora sp. NPDC054939]
MQERSVTETVGGLLPFGMCTGAYAWGVIGAARAATEPHYPWNAWTPLAYGVAKGVLIGLLAALCAGLARSLTDDRPAAVFAAALLGGTWCGTVSDLQGAPAPLLYYMDPMPDEQWYGRPLLVEWSTRTLLPAAGCALVLLTVAMADRARQPGGLRPVGAVLLSALAAALLVLPGYAAAGLPEPEGNGDHVNEGGVAGLTVGLLGLLVAVPAVRSLRRVRRESRCRPERPQLSCRAGSGTP